MKYCLIGEKLGHSFSAELHRAKGLDYSLTELKADELGKVFRGGYDGFNVTIPYKKAVIPYLDGLDKWAREIGAVNTVLKKDGKFYGYNTDIFGIEYTFSRLGTELKNKTVMILGSGGASATARAFAESRGAKEIITVSRTGEVNYFNCYDRVETEVLINATPVGTYPEVYAAPVDIGRFSRLEAVFDLVYNPLSTALVLSARERGIKCAGGLGMLVAQAVYSEKIWGYDFSENDIERTANELYRKKLNIVLYGMPSAGKTTVGKILADKLGKRFTDTDAEILSRTGRTPAEIIEKSGEAAFRDTESKIIKELAKESGAVIATGGGAVLRRENVDALKMNGVGVYIKRDLALLNSDGRPLSLKKGLDVLFGERKELYERAAVITALNDKKAEDCAEFIAKKFGEITL